MFELLGEEHGGSVYSQCPGDGCDMWDASAGDYDYKIESMVCAGCRDCGGNPPKPPGSDTDDEPDAGEVNDLVTDIEDIARWQNAGFKTDWSAYDYEICRLVRVWQDAEREVTALQANRMQVFLKSWMKQE